MGDVIVNIVRGGNSKGEAKGRNRHKSNRKRVVRNMGERKAGTKRAKSQTRPN